VRVVVVVAALAFALGVATSSPTESVPPPREPELGETD